MKTNINVNFLEEIARLDELDQVVMIGERNSFDDETGELLDYDDSTEIFICANCTDEFTEDQLKPCQDLSLRVSPGEIVPFGDCPNCGAFCYPREEPSSIREIQCGSCERKFYEADLTEDRECPFCFSGNWIFGNLDEAANRRT